jgi:RimJ/RimL family protein N-acetyltransferase
MPELRLPHTFDESLRTTRLLLRTMAPGDVDDIHAYQSREDVCRYVPYEPRTREEVAAKVAKHATARVLAADGDYWMLAVQRASDPGRVIGEVYFKLTRASDAGAEIGWALHPDFAGQGYMTEAAGAVLDVAFGTIGLHRVHANLDPRNTASVALCERLGMRQEAHFLEDMWFKGEWAGTLIYALLDREWGVS